MFSYNGYKGGRFKCRDKVLQLLVRGVVGVGNHMDIWVKGHQGPAGGQDGQSGLFFVPLVYIGRADLRLLHNSDTTGAWFCCEDVRQLKGFEGLHSLKAHLNPGFKLLCQLH